MAERMSKADVEKLLRAIAEANVVNLDASVSQVMDAAGPVLREMPNGDALALHILIVDHYAIVTE